MSIKKTSVKKLLLAVLIMVFSLSLTAYAQETEEDEMGDGVVEQADYTENVNLEDLGEPDQIVYGENNTSTNARVSMTGVLELAQYGTKVGGSYSTSYTYAVSRIGVKNMKLQYKNILGIWVTAVNIGERYTTNSSLHGGSFTCSGVDGRTYRLKATHYVIVDGTTIERDNATDSMKFSLD